MSLRIHGRTDAVVAPPSDAGLFSLWRVVDGTREVLDEELWERIGIRLLEWRVLREVVVDRRHVTARMIARRLGCSDANVSPIVQRLVREGRITRRSPQRVRVGYALRETAAGLDVYSAGEDIVREHAEAFFGELSREQRESLAIVAVSPRTE